MTISEFMDRYELKNEKLVVQWLENGLIAGASQKGKKQEWDIPELAKPPYTARRATTPKAIYVSIVKGILKGKSVSAKLYGIPQEEFDVYIENLEKCGFVSIKEYKGVTYYFATPKSEQYINDNNKLRKAIIDILDYMAQAAPQIAIAMRNY